MKWFVAFLLLTFPAFADVAPEDDAVLSQYAEDLKVQHNVDTGVCCTGDDVQIVKAEIKDDDWWVMFTKPLARPPYGGQPPLNEWIRVGPAHVLHTPNPTGLPIAWWYGGIVRCFWKPTLV